MASPTVPASASISVVIPCHNGARDIAEALDSVLAQTVTPLEVIVVDDGSTDESPQVLARYGDRIRVIRQDNTGLAGARNTGLAAARGEFIALMDHDDLCEPHRLAWQLAAFARWPDAVLCSSEFSAFDQRGPIEERHAARYYSRCSAEAGGVQGRYPQHGTLAVDGRDVPCLHGAVYEEIALGNFVHPPTVMFRRALLATAGPFDRGMGSMCDWEWLVRASRAGRFLYLDVPLLRYRRSATQMSSTTGQARGLLSALRVAAALVKRDPQLRRRRPRDFRHLFAELSIGAAYALAPDQPFDALGWLLKSMAYGHLSSLSLNVMVRAAVPQRWLDALRAMRRRRTGPAPG